MIVSIDKLMCIPEFSNYPKEMLKQKLDAIEQLIRVYTNNNFQNRNIRFQGNSAGNQIFGHNPFLKVDDTVQISQSRVNDGIYQIIEITDEYIRVDFELFTAPVNLITKIEYPSNVIAGAIDLMKWEVKNRQKVGIKSETLSRHSVTYYDQDANNQVMGYPVALLGFLKPYVRPRF